MYEYGNFLNLQRVIIFGDILPSHKNDGKDGAGRKCQITPVSKLLGRYPWRIASKSDEKPPLAPDPAHRTVPPEELAQRREGQLPSPRELVRELAQRRSASGSSETGPVPRAPSVSRFFGNTVPPSLEYNPQTGKPRHKAPSVSRFFGMGSPSVPYGSGMQVGDNDRRQEPRAPSTAKEPGK